MTPNTGTTGGRSARCRALTLVPSRCSIRTAAALLSQAGLDDLHEAVRHGY